MYIFFCFTNKINNLLNKIFEQRFAPLLHNIELSLDVELVVQVDLLETMAQILDFAFQLGLDVFKQHLGLVVFEEVGVGIGVLEGVARPGERVYRFEEKLPVDQSASAFVHYFLVDPELALFFEFFFELERIGVVDPPVIVMSVAVEGFAGVILFWVAFVPVAVVSGSVRFPVV
jgi:hypothetical protein